jgi:hypothetical protein
MTTRHTYEELAERYVDRRNGLSLESRLLILNLSSFPFLQFLCVDFIKSTPDDTQSALWMLLYHFPVPAPSDSSRRT